MTSSHFSINRLSLFAGLFLIYLVGAATWSAAQSEGAQTAQDKRSYIAEVDGFAYLSEDMTLSQTRKAAFLNAKRQAVEMAKTYISSHSRVEDFVLKEDVIEGTAEGAVTIIAQKDHGVEDNTRYRVWIKAEVEFGLKPPAAGASPAAAPAAVELDREAPLTVKVWSPKQHYRRGEAIQINIQGNRDFYARIVDITADGNIIQLLPNEFRRDNFFEAGRQYTVPGPEDGFELIVSPPYGQDQIVVYASEVPLGDVDTEPIGQGLSMYRGTRESLAVRTRGISVVGSKGKQAKAAAATPSSSTKAAAPQGAAFYEGTWTLTTGE